MCDQPAMQTRSNATKSVKVRAAAYGMLANGWRYPEMSVVELFGEPGRLSFWPEAAEALRPLDLEVLRGSYSRLFGHSVRGTCPPYELEYGRSEIIQQTAELADLTGFYSAFGMSISESAHERSDHLSVEFEFMSVLCAKEAWGRNQDHPELAETCADAQRLFLRDHLSRWLPAFTHRVIQAEPEGFYGRLAALAASFIAEECREFDIEMGPQWLELRPIDEARDAAIDCETSGCGASAANQLVQVGIQSPTTGESEK
ncbi:MAG: molecular chaperone TorD family protein [Planctomycetota bacterium]